MISLGAIVNRVRQAIAPGGWHRRTSGHNRVWLALRQTWLIWLALCIALAGTLVPSASMHSHGSNSKNFNTPELVEICTSAGQRWVMPDPVAQLSDKAPGGPSPASGFDDCPFCLRHIDRVAMPPSALPSFFSVSAPEVLPVWTATAFLPSHKPLSPSPRGPPDSP
jgi:hypothetical protein